MHKYKSKLVKMKENEYSIFDIIIILDVIILMIIGLLTLRSVVLGTSQESRFLKQLIWDLVSIAVMFYVIFEKETRIQKYSKYIYGASVVLLILVLFIGKTVYGAKRWIDIGAFDLQPSEIFKFSIILLMAYIFSKYQKEKAFLLSILAVSPSILIFLEPDLGMTILMLFIWFTMLLSSDVDKKYIFTIIGAGLLTAPLAFFFLLKDYQRARILAIFNPQEHFQYGAYNTIMSKTVIANGGVTGTGYGLGMGTNMHIVPMQYTDFIFSAYAEQFGLIGSIILLVLYGTIIFAGLSYIGRYKDRFWEFIAIGVCAVFAFHVFENIGMNLGILPVTGIPLPFISYGGTSTVVFAAIAGLLIKARVISKKARQVIV
ncbi:MAG: FtsW/RodA/SpoVE family cell cycle protein [Fervidobacterium sp.]|uniref:FtsW/RodA/SpoVE family cell cycle protein n=1 Tax=Fervidobacterium sp. TaxID=1871331 RepID=UPI0040491C56